MPTHDYDIANQSGAAFRTDLNNALKAIQTNNSNSSSPASTEAFQFWADTTAGTLKIRNAANNAWIELFQLDGTLTLEDGSNSAPALAFRDDLDTGIYSSAANTFNVATGGTERMELGTVTIFNETGADVDFRIEGDSEANLFYVDAGQNRVAVGTNNPSATFDVVGDIEATIAATSSYGEGLNITNGTNADFNVNIKNSSTSIGPSTATPLCFHVSGSANEKMRINSDGKVGIGVTNPLYPLHVNGLVADSSPADFGVLMGLSSGDDYAQIQLNGDTGAFIDFSTSGTDQKGRILYIHSTERFEFFVNSGKRVQFTEDGIIPNGTDTTSANALDDYEEGTYTPAPLDGTAQATPTDGQYTKIGNFCIVTGSISLNGDATTSGNMFQFTLPFTAGGGRAGSGVIRYTNSNHADTPNITFHVNAGQANVALYVSGGGTFTYAEAGTNRFDFCMLYRTA